jgi:hypothetical protein
MPLIENPSNTVIQFLNAKQKSPTEIQKEVVEVYDEAQNLLGCTAVFLIECRPTFQRYVLPSSSG